EQLTTLTPPASQVRRNRTASISTRCTSTKSKITRGPPRSISTRRSSSCSDRRSPLRRIRVPRFRENRSILSVINVGSGVHPSQSHEKAVCNLLKANNLDVSVAVKVRQSVTFQRYRNLTTMLMQKEIDLS